MLGAPSARAAITLPAVLADHMVLQQDGPVVWGRAAPGSRIAVALGGATASGNAGPDGRWTIAFRNLPAGGPLDMRFSGDGEVTLHDVLVGEVWIGAGQSNMLVPVASTTDGAHDATRPGDDRIRVFVVESAAAAAPLRDVRGRWTVCTREAIAHLPAVAWYFAHDLRAALGVPVGVVVGAWTGTSIDVWLPSPAAEVAGDATEQAARGTPFELSFTQMRLLARDRTALPVPFAIAAGSFDWHAQATAGSSATFAAVPGSGAGRFAGVLAGDHARATLGTRLGSDGRFADWTGFAALAFRARGRGSFGLSLTTGSGSDADVRVSRAFDVSREWAQVVIPLDSLQHVGAGRPRALATDAIAALSFGIVPAPPRAPGSAWNGTFAPLAPLRARGVLWYQGEADAGRPARYGELLTRLVRDWRAAWHAPELPFLVVQLPGYRPPPGDAGAGHWAELRQAQRAVLTLPATGVVTTIDLGEPNDIHPAGKPAFGERLALAAERLVYGKAVPASGPELEQAEVRDRRLRLRFTDTGGDLAARGGPALVGFELSADGNAFAPANARIVDRATVEVWNDAVPAPVEVRYAWADDPRCNLVDAAGLPAAPFRTRVGGGGPP